MKTNKVLFLVVLLILLAAPVYGADFFLRDSYNITTDGLSSLYPSGTGNAVLIQPVQTYNVSRVDWYMAVVGSPTAKLEIWSHSEATEKPDVKLFTLSAKNFSATTAAWINFTNLTNSYQLDSGTKYWLVFMMYDAASPSKYAVSYGEEASGILGFSYTYDYGVVWEALLYYRNAFRAYSYNSTMGAPSFIPPTPDDGWSNNTNVTINVSCAGNVYLYFDNKTNPTMPVLENSTIHSWTTNVTQDNQYYYKASCWNESFGFSSNTTVRMWVYDLLSPITYQTFNIPFYLNNKMVNVSTRCEDTSSTLLYNLTFNYLQLLYANITSNTTITNTTTLIHGINNYTSECINHFGSDNETTTRGVYLLNYNVVDEGTLQRVNTLTNVGFQAATSYNTSFNNGTANITLPSSGFTSIFSVSGYNTKYLVVSADNYSIQNITVYMSNSSNTVVFTVVDGDAATQLLEGVLVQMYRTIGESDVLIDSHYTDVVGQVQFYYTEGVSYTFKLNKEGYVSKTFTLSPIIQNAYTIKLSKSTTLGTMPDYSSVFVSYNPTTYSSPSVGTFTFILTAPGSILTYYGYTMTYPGGVITHSGTSPTGQEWSDAYTIGIVPYGSTVNLTYFYNSTLSGYRSFKTSFRINTASNLLMAANQNNNYGLGLFEKTFVSTIIIIFIAGIGGLAAGFAAGLVLSILTILFLLYIGFISWWSFGITLFIAAMILFWRVDI